VGDVDGQFLAVFQKIAALHSKNNFSFALIVGNLFASPGSTTDEDSRNIQKLINGEIRIPLPTYFVLGTQELPTLVVKKLDESEGELCENVFFLGKRAIFKTSQGIRIVSLGGSRISNQTEHEKTDKHLPFYSDNDANILRGANSAHILVTSQWPDGIHNGSKVDLDTGHTLESQTCVAELCTALKPRYHFSTSPLTFYEREPFYHDRSADQSETFHITRFISLGSFTSPNKAKWIYAFSLDPTASPPISLPAAVTSSPFPTSSRKRSSQPDQNPIRFSTEGRYSRSSDHRPRKRKRPEPLTQEECFFCLSNSDLATHLITSIGNETYLTTAKGPLSTGDTFPSLGFPGHILIIPFSHSPTLSLISDAESRANTIREMHRYRDSMNSMLMSKSSQVLGTVTWEVSRLAGFHTHWQWLPAPLSLIRKGLVEAAFKVEAENLKYPCFTGPKPTPKSPEPSEDDSSDFFRVMIWNPQDGSDAEMRLLLDPSFKFDIQFGRRVMAKLLELEGRADWHDCWQSHEDEAADADEFKRIFKEFDFSLEE